MSDLDNLSTASKIATTVLAKIHPAAGVFGSQVSIPAAMAQLMEDIATGNLSDTELYVLGYGEIPASHTALDLTARTLALLALGGAAAAGVMTLGVPAAIAAGAAGVATLTNPQIKELLTDPEFWEDVGQTLSDPSFWEGFWQYMSNPWKVPAAVNDYWVTSGTILPRKDPLALDLNGDGIATIPASAGITFDHNNSGVECGTGWINPSDGWLALDRNGNGKIDSGRELFGDNTLKLGGNKAAHAYDALASFDSNKDGQISAADATGDIDNNGVIDGAETYWDINGNGSYDAGVDNSFADLRVWVDANSNGNTDSGELKTLAELNIVAIATDKTAVNTVDASGNLNTFVGNYTTASGEVVDGARAFNLVENKFFRQWSNSVNVSPAVAALPNMQGSGAVRDLHEAMSLGTPEAAILKNTVQQFAAATSRNTQYALVDKLIGEWSRTAEFDDMVERLERMTTTYRNFQTNQMAHYEYRFALATGMFWNTVDVNDDFYCERYGKYINV